MSRVAKSSITIPTSVEVIITGNLMSVKGRLGQLNMSIHPCVAIVNNNSKLSFNIISIEKKEQKKAWAQAGTARANTANLIRGVTDGWKKKLTLIGVGYRAKVMGKILDLTLGFSHPINYKFPEDIIVETPSQTEIIIKGMDKQKVGQVASEIRSYRPPEPYKGKGIRYIDEQVIHKETKKK